MIIIALRLFDVRPSSALYTAECRLTSLYADVSYDPGGIGDRGLRSKGVRQMYMPALCLCTLVTWWGLITRSRCMLKALQIVWLWTLWLYIYWVLSVRGSYIIALHCGLESKNKQVSAPHDERWDDRRPTYSSNSVATAWATTLWPPCPPHPLISYERKTFLQTWHHLVNGNDTVPGERPGSPPVGLLLDSNNNLVRPNSVL